MTHHDQRHAEADFGPPEQGPALGSDFRLRLVWGYGLAAVAAAFIFSGAVSFSVLIVIVALLLSWEWSRLVHGPGADIVLAVHMAAAFAAAVLAAFGYVGLGLLALCIGAILTVVLSLGHNSVYAAIGVFYAGLPAIALIWLRGDVAFGLRAVVYLIMVVIAADTAAFLCGRLLGGPKLWPRISPNKTWSGLIGAVIASTVVGAWFWLVVPGVSPVRLAATAAVLGFIAQIGDLAESGLKRHFGVKDSSHLIPGHGGVMDRVDGLVAAASAAGLIGMAINVHSPARALLLGW
jgi:phosphatidate cytidylyltransferase